MDTRESLRKARRIVVKVGSSTLTQENGKLDLPRMDNLVQELAALVSGGHELILVSSGAVAAGMARMGLNERPDPIEAKQALAAIGQGILMDIYEKLFARHELIIAQILLTKENSLRHKHYTNCRNVLQELLRMGVIPVINENDAVAADELKIGDNDNLSAVVAALVDADALIILSDIEGLYTANPQTDKEAVLIKTVSKITRTIEDRAGGAGSGVGTGGMRTKIQAARVAVNAGVTMVIASGAKEGILRDILNGEERGTVFLARKSHLQVRKSWLAFGKQLAGDIIIDDGCARAVLKEGSSILPAGVIRTAGNFQAGNTVRVISEAGREIARGIVNYDSASLTQISGLHTVDIADVLPGSKYQEEVIHRDNMVLMA